MSENSFNIHEWEKEKMDALVKYNHYKDGVSDGFEDGFDKATTKVTKKSEEEILKIKESIINN